MTLYEYVDMSLARYEAVPDTPITIHFPLSRWCYLTKYVSHTYVAPVLFSCEAEGILEADRMFAEATGIIPRGANHIGCRFFPLIYEGEQ